MEKKKSRKRFYQAIRKLRELESLTLPEAGKKYTIGGWGSINPDVKGPAIYNVLEDYILDKQNISPMQNNPVTIKGI